MCSSDLIACRLAWTGSWTGAPDNPSAANAASAMTCGIGAASAQGVRAVLLVMCRWPVFDWQLPLVLATYWRIEALPVVLYAGGSAAMASIEMSRPRGSATLAGAERAGGGSGMNCA